MESLQDRLDKRVFQNVFITRHLLFGTVIYHHHLQTEFSNFGWPFNRGQDYRKPIIGMNKRWPLSTGFIYSILLTILNFGTLMTGRRLVDDGLYLLDHAQRCFLSGQLSRPREWPFNRGSAAYLS